VCVLSRFRSGRGARSVWVTRLRSAAAFRAVLAHAHCFAARDPARNRRMMESYLRLVARVPIWRVRFTPGLEHLDAVLDALEQAGAESVCPRQIPRSGMPPRGVSRGR